MQIFKEIEPLRAFLVEKRRAGLSIGFVPTMGALHAGHLSLIVASRAQNQITVCSIFINPIQFNNPNDLVSYPRTLDKDLTLLNSTGCDVLFCPDEAQMEMSVHSLLNFSFGTLETVMEGKFRPGHFNGVAKVVAKLLHIVEPDTAYFGQKDWQQFVIIRALVEGLRFNVKLQSVETVREQDGLAMSSRNLRLSEGQRKQATLLYSSLCQARQKLKAGDSILSVKEFVNETFRSKADFSLEYFEVVDSENLMPLNNVHEAERPMACIAAFAGNVRLIDNMFLL
ncbi:MAG: pantoate--beta-alanine ligase [Cyclobacteriaceae bacterium]|nr:pantoate--beta-alanine ligase [Cyclobacteriaceae bacterium]UYN87144.1 MAG: pantoate--beta-alanine ligase [Cyclobacteriaceae bacterium]